MALMTQFAAFQWDTTLAMDSMTLLFLFRDYL